MLEAWAGFPQDLAQTPFPSVAFALFPFAVVNHGLERDYMLCPGSPPSESPNPGVVLQT